MDIHWQITTITQLGQTTDFSKHQIINIACQISSNLNLQKEKYFNAKENRNVAVHFLGIKGNFVTKINELFELQKYDQNLTMNLKISQSLF